MKKEKTALSRIGWRSYLWLPALLLLCNPNFHTLDLLPDVIGYVLLLVALRRLSDLDESFFEVKRACRRMAWLSVARGASLIWVLSFTAASEQPTLLLLCTFVIGVLELIVILPACTQLFRGLAYQATRLDGSAVFETVSARRIARINVKMERLERRGELTAQKREKMERRVRALGRQRRRDVTDHACRACQTFAVVKTALCVVPELAALSYGGYEVGASKFPWYSYINGFRAMAFVVGIVVGIVWLCRMISYCRHIARDTSFWERLETRCREDEAAHPARVPARRLRSAWVCISIALALGINFYVDNVNVLPGMLTPVALLVSLLFLHRYLPRLLTWTGIAVFAANAGVSTYAYLSQIGFFDEFYLSSYHGNWNVRAAYADRVLLPAAIEAVFALASLTVLALIVFCLIDRYTGSHGAATYQYSKEQLATIRRNQLKRHLLLPLIFGVVAIVMHVLYFYWLPEREMIWLVDFATAAAFAIFGPWRLWDVREDLDAERMLAPITPTDKGAAHS